MGGDGLDGGGAFRQFAVGDDPVALPCGEDGRPVEDVEGIMLLGDQDTLVLRTGLVDLDAEGPGFAEAAVEVGILPVAAGADEDVVVVPMGDRIGRVCLLAVLERVNAVFPCQFVKLGEHLLHFPRVFLGQVPAFVEVLAEVVQAGFRIGIDVPALAVDKAVRELDFPTVLVQGVGGVQLIVLQELPLFDVVVGGGDRMGETGPFDLRLGIAVDGLRVSRADEFDRGREDVRDVGVLGADASVLPDAFGIEDDQAVVGAALIVRPFLVVAERRVAGLGPAGGVEGPGPLVPVVVVLGKFGCDVGLLLLRRQFAAAGAAAFA